MANNFNDVIILIESPTRNETIFPLTEPEKELLHFVGLDVYFGLASS